MDNVAIIEALLAKQEELKPAYEQYLAYDKVIASLKNGTLVNGNALVQSNGKQLKIAGFDKMSDRQKVANVIKTVNRFLHVREIAEMLYQLQPSISAQAWVKKVSPALSFLKAKDAITKVVVGGQNTNTFWGSKSWLTEDGQVKPEHMYNEAYLQPKNEIIEI